MKNIPLIAVCALFVVSLLGEAFYFHQQSNNLKAEVRSLQSSNDELKAQIAQNQSPQVTRKTGILSSGVYYNLRAEIRSLQSSNVELMKAKFAQNQSLQLAGIRDIYVPPLPFGNAVGGRLFYIAPLKLPPLTPLPFNKIFNLDFPRAAP